MTYRQALEYLESFINYEKLARYPYKESLKLERLKGFLAAIGNPQDSLRCIHVAGTKGKGSTCAFIAYILRQAGYKTGLYTSPHLSDFRERIRILKPVKEVDSASSADFEGMISVKSVTDLTARLKPVIDRYNRACRYGPLSFFEVYTSLAFMYFKEERADFVVLETGLGGRLDATNCANSLVYAITPISYEHTQKLGNTLKEIAAEKAGIIKGHKVTRSQGHTTIAIAAPQKKEALTVIKAKCKEAGARLYEVGKDIKYTKHDGSFNIKGIFEGYRGLKIRLYGEHQLINASVAVAAVEALRFFGRVVKAEQIKEGLLNTVWPGRCEILSRRPLIVLDGAQNVASASALKKTIKTDFRYKKLILVLGISSDKDIKGVCSQLYDLADKAILTKADNPRAARPNELAGYFKGKETYITQSVKEAKAMALRLADKKDLILITGSLFVVGEARNKNKEGDDK